MCNQRERLIGFIYGEGDAGDRAEVQRHVDACAECRAEVAALRSVREDLLAWDVPAHESVWRPFVAAPVVPWWRQVPAWAMAAAAGVMMLLGVAGGAAVQAFAPGQTLARQSDVPAPAAPVLTSADLTAAEQRILARMQRDVGVVGARVEQVASNRSQFVSVLEGDHTTLAEELLWLRARNKEQLDVIKDINARLDRIGSTSATRSNDLEQKISELRTLVVTQLQLK